MARNKKDEELSVVLGKRIKELAGERKHSAIARQIGVKPNTFWGYLNGLTMPSYKVLLKLADHFNVSVDWLLRGQESPVPKDPIEMKVISCMRRISDKSVAKQVADYALFLSNEHDRSGSERHEVWGLIIKTQGLDTLGKRMAYIREMELGISPSEFAEELGITVVELNNIEADKTRPRASTLTTYQSKFNSICPLDILLSG